MKIQKMKIPAILGALLVAGTLSAGAQMNSDSLYKEPYRPQYHFSPEKGWIGDPSGFMYYQGKYHMYWWGKVESTDLVHYQQITPYAMTGADDNISYFTGSAVVDKNNTASARVLMWRLTPFLRRTPRNRRRASLSVMTERHFIIMKVTRFWTLEYGIQGPYRLLARADPKMGDGCSQGPGEENKVLYLS